MAAFRRFEDVEAWQQARGLTRQIYRVTKRGAFAKDFSLRDQIQRASVSIMSHIAEGFERSGNRAFLQCLSTARDATGQVRNLLYVALDADYVDQDVFDALCAHTEQVSRLLSNLMRYLRRTNLKGSSLEP